MTLRSFVSMIVLAGMLALPASALVAEGGERAAAQEGKPRAAGGQFGVCCFGFECVPTGLDEFSCPEQGGTWHPNTDDCSVCQCGKPAPAGTDCWHTVCGATHYDFATHPPRKPADGDRNIRSSIFESWNALSKRGGPNGAGWRTRWKFFSILP